MKFRTRLIVSFAIVIVVPVILAAMLIYGVYFMQRRATGGNSTYNMVTDSIQLMSHYTTQEYRELKSRATDEPDSLLNASYLQQVNDSLRNHFSYLVMRVNDEVVFNGAEKSVTVPWSELPAYGESGTAENSFEFIEGRAPTLVRQIDFEAADGRQGSIYLITMATDTLPEVRKLIWQFITAILLILVLTAILLTAWIYRGIVPQVDQLTKAADNIREGNLNFRIETKGDDEFARLGSAFEDMRQRLQESAAEKLEAEKEQKQLISNIAHDLKTPITAIKGYAEGIMDGIARTPEKQAAYIRTIYNKAGEMDTLINELTTYSKIDTNGIPYNFQHINVKNYFMDCADELSMDLENQQISLAYYDYADDDVEVIADPEQLQRVIHNIVGNSVKYMGHPGGHINMRVKDVGDFVQVEIEDDGQGIDQGDLPYIFDRTFRGDASRNSGTGGSGIGLAVVRKIVEDHGGKVWATSKVGVGTVMYFVLRKYKVEEQ